MSRVTLSMIGGAVIPVLCFAVGISTFCLINALFGSVPHIVEVILLLPVGWTTLIYDKLFPSQIYEMFNFTPALLTIFFNYILYFLLTYGILHYLKIPSVEQYKIISQGLD